MLLRPKKIIYLLQATFLLHEVFNRALAEDTVWWQQQYL